MAQAEQPPPAAATVQFISPTEGSVLLGRRPEIRATFTGPPPAELLVILDGTDITPLLDITPGGFTYQPTRALTAGSHQLAVVSRDADGSDAQAIVSFSSRHGETVLESSSQNELGYVYDLAVAKHQYPALQPTQKLEGTLRTDSRFKTDHWQLGFSGTLRHLDQNTPLTPPLRRGVDATTWLLSLGYSRDLASAEARFGDVQINETSYTVTNLARRGGDFSLIYDRFRLYLFNVAGQQHFGLRGGTGLSGNTDRHVSGVAASGKFLADRVEVKAVAATGGEAGPSYNLGTLAGGKKGSVAGGQINTDFFQGLLRSELEMSWTHFDDDRTDAMDARNDKAWRAKLGGGADTTTYEAQYEYVGPNFTSIGNLVGIPKDRQGVTARAGTMLGAHSLSASFSRYADNVADDPGRARLVYYQGGVDYSCGSWPGVPLGVSWQKSLQQSEHEPTGLTPIDLDTDTLSGWIGYLAGDFRIQAVATGSRQNDTTVTDSDATTATYQLSPAYGHDQTQLAATAQLTQTWRTATDRTDLLTATIDLRSAWLDNRLTGELAGTFNQTIRNGTSKSLMLNSRLGYALPEYWGGVKSSLALRGSYNHSYDRTAGVQNRDELAAFLVLATTVPVIW